MKGWLVSTLVKALKFLSNNLFSIAEKVMRRLLHSYKLYVCKDQKLVAYCAWMKVDGDRTLLLNCGLAKGDVVFDVGGYIGDFAHDVSSSYGANVFVFEPVSQYYRNCLSRFSGNAQIQCFNFGLSGQDGRLEISLSNDGSSVVRSIPGSAREVVEIRSLNEFVKAHGIDRINLLKMNIEGGEYPLLQHIFETGLIARIDNLRVQFHDFVPKAGILREKIRKQLSETHDEIWCYPFIWESWERKT